MQTGEDQQREIEARLEVAEARTAQTLDADAERHVRQGIAYSLALRAAMRRAPLTNADGPSPAFDPAPRHDSPDGGEA